MHSICHLTCELCSYPDLPRVGQRKPVERPKKVDGSSVVLDNLGPDSLFNETKDVFEDQELDGDFKTPGCADRTALLLTANLNSKCEDTNAVTEVPFNVFDIAYKPLCLSANCNHRALNWVADSTGNILGLADSPAPPTRKLRRSTLNRRTPPPNSDNYKDYKFLFSWNPVGGKCVTACDKAYLSLSRSLCGHLGGQSKSLRWSSIERNN